MNPLQSLYLRMAELYMEQGRKLRESANNLVNSQDVRASYRAAAMVMESNAIVTATVAAECFDAGTVAPLENPEVRRES